jgi:hypothetical protein
MNPFRPNTIRSANEIQSFRFSVKIFNWSVLAGGPEPTLDGNGCIVLSMQGKTSWTVNACGLNCITGIGRLALWWNFDKIWSGILMQTLQRGIYTMSELALWFSKPSTGFACSRSSRTLQIHFEFQPTFRHSVTQNLRAFSEFLCLKMYKCFYTRLFRVCFSDEKQAVRKARRNGGWNSSVKDQAISSESLFLNWDFENKNICGTFDVHSRDSE